MRFNRPYSPLRHPNIGFSLIELLVTLSVITICLSLSLPGLSQWLQHSTENTILKSIHHLVSFA